MAMEKQKIEIPWNDGSGENITLTFSENSKGEVEVLVSSPKQLLSRKRSLRLRTKDTYIMDLEVEQPEDYGEGIKDMEIGVNFIIR